MRPPTALRGAVDGAVGAGRGEGVGHSELGEPVGREPVGLGLGSVLGGLADRGAGGDEA